METLKYKVITTDKQYNKYCKILEELVFSSSKLKAVKEEIALLTLLIEKYDEELRNINLADPIELLKSLLKEHSIKASDLAKLLHVSEGLVSDMLNYKKGLSKNSIRILAEKFKLNQKAFNQPYKLRLSNSNVAKSKIMAVNKKLKTA